MAGPLRCLRRLPLLLRCTAMGVDRPSLQAPPTLNCCRDPGARWALQARPFASKKARAKGKGPARMSINASLVEDIVSLEALREDLQGVVRGLQEELSRNVSIRTSPGALDQITVATKDGRFPLNQLGQVSLKSPQLVLVNMSNFPESAAAAIKAIRESGMNLNPEADGLIIRVPIPKVTREHRESLAVLAKQLTHKAKEALRKMRAGAVSQTRKAKSSASEDTLRLVEKQIQQMADDAVAEMEALLAAKTKELLG